MGRGPDDKQWIDPASAAFAEIAEWRRTHPKATLAEIEAAVDERLRRVRERVVTDTVHTSAAAEFTGEGERPACPDCGRALQAYGKKRRWIRSHTGGGIELNRIYGYCPRCAAGFFPPG